MTDSLDRSMLLGALALQLDLVRRDQLIAGMQTWVRDTSRSLDELLVDQGALDELTQRLLRDLVQKHIELHGSVEDSVNSLSRHSAADFVEIAESLGDTRLGNTSIVRRQKRGEEFTRDRTRLGASSPTLPREGDTLANRSSLAVPGYSTSGERYRILQRHAQGGLGVVSLAWDQELKREVAVKEIREEYANQPESRARFVLEAEITGGLEHPGVVPVYSLEHSADHPLRYAMQFVRGKSLKEEVHEFHAQSHSRPGDRALELRKLLGRFVDVCQAVEYAHSRGVLHRDLKPANIMLGKHGETLVVDWGLAKVTGQSADAGESAVPRGLASSSAAGTRLGSAVGTPAYMSPEQAAGRLDEVTARSDVYSLGATLYYLLAGRAAFQGQSMEQLLEQVVAGRFPSVREIQPATAPSLEAICLKAMASEPQQRYASAADLAEDIERFLADEPVSCYRAPLTVRGGRWLRKHPAATSATAISALLLLVFFALGFTTVSRFNRRLEAALSQSENNFQIARGAVADYLSAVTTNRKLNQSDFNNLRIELLETALPFFQRLLRDSPQDAATRAGRADANYRLAVIYGETGKLAASREQAELAIASYTQLLAARPENASLREDLADAYTVLAATLARQGELQQSQQNYVLAQAEHQRLADQQPDNVEYRRQVASAHNNLGTAWLRLGEIAKAQAEFERGIAGFRELLQNDPGNELLRRSLAAGHSNLGSARVEAERRPEAIEQLEAARELLQTLVDQTNDRQYRRELANVHEMLGVSKRRLGRANESLAHHQQVLDSMQQLVNEFPTVPEYRDALAGALGMMARLNADQGDFDTAVQRYDAAIEIYAQLAKSFPGTPNYLDELARTHMNFAMMLGDVSRKQEALEHAHDAIELRQQLVQQFPQVAGLAKELALCYVALGVAFAENDDTGAAAEEFARAVEQYESLVALIPPTPI